MICSAGSAWLCMSLMLQFCSSSSFLLLYLTRASAGVAYYRRAQLLVRNLAEHLCPALFSIWWALLLGGGSSSKTESSYSCWLLDGPTSTASKSSGGGSSGNSRAGCSVVNLLIWVWACHDKNNRTLETCQFRSGWQFLSPPSEPKQCQVSLSFFLVL